MKRALEEAERALGMGEVPVGCVFVCDGVEVAHGSNQTNTTMNPTRHAEFVAIYSTEFDDWARCELYVTCEPCIMCASAMAQLGLRRVYFGCRNDKFGGCGSILSLHKGRYDCFEGCGKSEAIALFRQFYARHNERTIDTPLAKRRFRIGAVGNDDGGAFKADEARGHESQTNDAADSASLLGRQLS